MCFVSAQPSSHSDWNAAGDAAAPQVVATRDGYDRWAAVYDEEDNPLVALETPHVARLLGDVAGLSILDVGCGTGRHALRLAERGARVTAIDFSTQMLEKARAKPGAQRVAFLRHDLTADLPFGDAAFDGVVCGLVTDHISDLDHLFSEMGRVCRPEGHITVSTMHPAMMLRGVQARFTDSATGRKLMVASCPHQLCDYINAVRRAGLTISWISEHAPDEALAARCPRAVPYVGWPMLLMLQLRRQVRWASPSLTA